MKNLYIQRMRRRAEKRKLLDLVGTSEQLLDVNDLVEELEATLSAELDDLEATHRMRGDTLTRN